MDAVDLGFTLAQLGIGSLLVGISIWTLLTASLSGPTYWQRMAAIGMMLIGVGLLVGAPARTIADPRLLRDVSSLLSAAFMLSGAALAVTAAVRARRPHRSA